jgi:poly-gamma-glutamate synthesis protein (capsule biosynthesis protein)
MRPPRRRSPLVALIVALTVLLAACATSDGSPPLPSPVPATSAPPSATAIAVMSPSPAPATAPPPSPEPSPSAPDGTSITISAVGDISLAREVVARMAANGTDYPYALVAPLVTGDIGFANLEGALTDRGEPWPKGYNFRTPPRFATGLIAAHFSIVTLANNHAMDYGAIGLQDTIAALDAIGVRHIGAGDGDAAAHAPVVIEAHGLKVAFLGYVATPDEGGGFSINAWAAGPATPGLALGSGDAISADVTAARRVADFVVVAVHAGTEYSTTPNDIQRSLAQAALAAGADAYIGAHAHVVQPVERHGQQLIAWGLGNFIFDLDSVDLANIPQPRVSLILNITLTKGAGVTAYSAVPVTQDANEDRPRPATPDEVAVLNSLIGTAP